MTFFLQVYDTTDGALIQPLKGHKDIVYCVAYAKDGTRHYKPTPSTPILATIATVMMICRCYSIVTQVKGLLQALQTKASSSGRLNWRVFWNTRMFEFTWCTHRLTLLTNVQHNESNQPLFSNLIRSHNDSIQCVAYNPVTHQLASCSSGDFGECNAI